MRSIGILLASLPTVLLIVQSSIFADQGQASLGLRSTLTVSTVEDRFGDNLENGLDGGIGAALTIECLLAPLSRAFGMQIDVGYSQRGFDLADQSFIYSNSKIGHDTAVLADAELQLHYIDLDLLLKARYSFGRLTPYALCGATLSAFAQSDMVFSGPELTFDSTLVRSTGAVDTTYLLSPSDAYYNVNDHDVAFVIGGGVDIALGERLVLFFDIRYQHGLVVVERRNRFRSRCGQGSVGVKLPFR